MGYGVDIVVVGRGAFAAISLYESESMKLHERYNNPHTECNGNRVRSGEGWAGSFLLDPSSKV